MNGEMQTPKTLVTEIMSEIDRVNEVIKDYESIGPSGKLAIILFRLDIDRARLAIAEWDPIGMLRALNTLRDIKS